MSILPVRLFTDKILHQSCLPVKDFIGLDNIVESMISTMFEYKGVGLAAPQVGLLLNLAVMNLENKSKLIVVVNPKVLCYTKEVDTQLEGCLSAPGVSIPIKRYLGIEIEAQNLLGETVQYRLEGYDSRIAQHELSHLNGIMITDNLLKL